MLDFRDYIWRGLRWGIVQFWVLFALLSLASYTAVLTALKHKELRSSLSVAAYTVGEALKAGDWSLAIGHLRALEKAGPVFDIQLRRESEIGNVTGPFGEAPWGAGNLCKQATVGPGMTLSGCMKVFGLAEAYTLLLFLGFASILFLVVFRFFRGRMLFFIDRVSAEIRGMCEITPQGDQETSAHAGQPISEIHSVRQYILRLLKERETAAEAIAMSRLSAQVAHDIRSPLTALDSLLRDVSQVPEEKRVLLRRAVSRIRDIANNLLDRKSSTKNAPIPARRGPDTEVHLVSGHLEAIVSEKRYQYQDRSGIDIDFPLDPAGYGGFARLDPNDFKRVVSNLLDNAIEAIGSSGSVTVSLATEPSSIIIEVKDTGRGIEPEILPLLGQRGRSFKKEKGSGLGLYHAKTTVKSWGGRLSLTSEPNRGTTVRIELPRHDPPAWFLGALEVVTDGSVAILDDDQTIHMTWDSRLGESGARPKIHHLYRADAFREWWKGRTADSWTLCLIDYELMGEQVTGLDLIEELGLESCAVLVTSRFEEPSVLERCLAKGIKLLPKALANTIPIIEGHATPDAILIDDEDIVHMNWEHSARTCGRSLKSFRSASSFLVHSEGILDRSPAK